MTGPAPRLVGDGIDVPLLGGGRAPFVNLDFAASAPALEVVSDTVEEFLPYYSSVHRGAGFKSVLSTEVYEQARVDVAAFVGARPDDVVCFTTNTTGALNVLSAAVPNDARVVAFGSEHHANLLPWHRCNSVFLDAPGSAEAAVAELDGALERMAGGPVLVTVTAASNVTGEVWPVAELAAVCRRHGARIAVDCAQLAPHAPIDIAAWDVDWIALSGHKLYAPYGSGALVGRRDWLESAAPHVRGGGAVEFVTSDGVMWAAAPERQEAGSPNVVGAVALAAACRALRTYGMDRVAREESALEAYLAPLLDAVPGLQRYLLWGPEHPRIGVFTFNLPDIHYSLVAAALSAEYGIGVRDGCFCAHPLMLRLLGVDERTAEEIRRELAAGRHARVPGAVRLSAGLSTTTADLDRAVDALMAVATTGPRGSYRFVEETGHYVPDPDDRPRPRLAALGDPTPSMPVAPAAGAGARSAR